jgi:hypothetical protein
MQQTTKSGELAGAQNVAVIEFDELRGNLWRHMSPIRPLNVAGVAFGVVGL